MASLACELFILKVAGIEEKDVMKYVGRGQYPKFQDKSMVRGSPVSNKYYNKHILFWADVRSHCKMIGFAMGAMQQEETHVFFSS